MTIRAGRMPYLNSDVFYWTLPEDAAELVALPPRAMAAAVESGELDAGPLPMAEVIRMGDLLAPIGDYCVATKRESVSILLFSKVEAEGLAGRRIAVTDHTSSTIQLLRVLLAERWHAEPAGYVELGEPNDAVLLIGDPALQARNGVEGYRHVYDLGSQWHEHTGGLPFVYAQWVARRDTDPDALGEFTAALGRAYDEGVERFDEIASGRPELGMTIDEKLSYLRGFSYRLGEPERASVARFRESLAELPAWRPGDEQPEAQSLSA